MLRVLLLNKLIYQQLSSLSELTYFKCLFKIIHFRLIPQMASSEEFSQAKYGLDFLTVGRRKYAIHLAVFAYVDIVHEVLSEMTIDNTRII